MFTSRPVSAVIRSVPSSGRSFQTNTVLTQQEPTTETLISNSRELMYTTMRPPVADMCLEQFLWILSQVPWILLELAHSVNFLDQIISFLVKQVLETTGPKDIIQKELNLSILFLMLLERKQKVAIASKDFK